MSEKCDSCSAEYEAIYWVPEHVWQKIKPKQDGFGGLLCIECAHSRALSAGHVLRFSGSDDGWGSNE